MPRRHQRGASAVEFAVILPVFLTLVAGMIDYGHYFALQSQAMSAVSGALYAGAHVAPTTADGPGECADCQDAAATHAVMALDNLGLQARRRDLIPDIRPLSGTCALSLDVVVDHQPIVGLVPTPTRHRFSVNALLLKVDAC